MQQTTCNRQQTTCKRTRAVARCNGKHTAPPRIVCSEQRAADNQQHARSIVLDNQCATRHRRHTGAAACSKHTRNRQHAAGNAMHGMRDETKGSRTLAHLGAASGSLRRPSGVQVDYRSSRSRLTPSLTTGSTADTRMHPVRVTGESRLDCGAALVRRQLVS